MTKRVGIIFLIILILIIFKSIIKPPDFKSNLFKVSKVISGNQIMLLNGFTVNLIGIEDSPIVKKKLFTLLKGNKEICFVFDSQMPNKKFHPKARDKSFYAYAVMNGQCLNSLLLKEEISRLNIQPCLSDSLESYLSYANITENEILDQQKPIIDDGCQGLLPKLIEACDYMNPTTRDFAVSKAGKSSGEFSISQICDVFASIRPPFWHYVNDPAQSEYFSKASRTINSANLSGDCDDFAVLMYSLITAIGGRARINFVYGKSGGHAYTEVDISGFEITKIKKVIQQKFPEYKIDNIYYYENSDAKWLNLDWWASHPGGPYLDFYHQMVFYPDLNNCQ